MSSRSERRGEAAGRSELPNHPFVLRHVRHNFTSLVVDPACYMLGMGFLDPATVLPALMSRLGAAPWELGLVVAVLNFGWTVSALIGAHAIHGQPYHKRYLVLWNVVSRAGILFIPPALLLYGADRPDLARWTIIAALILFGLTKGLTITSWYDVIAKTIPPKIRGRFFGTQSTAVSAAGLVSSLLVLAILRSDRLAFPGNFALLSLLAFVGLMLSLAALAAIREPAGPEVADRGDLIAYVRRIRPLLREHPGVGRLVVARLLLDAGALALPFYAGYAEKSLGQPLAMVGVYAIVKSLARVVSGIAWGTLSDRRGPALTFRLAGAVAVLPPLLALAAPAAPWLLVLTFALMGVAEAGIWSGYGTRIVGAVDETDRPLALGIANVGLAPIALYGLIGGWLVGVASFATVFALAALVVVTGVLLATAWDRSSRTAATVH